MPREKKNSKRSRASSDSDALQDSLGISKVISSPPGKGRGASKKRRKSTPGKQTAESKQDPRPPEPPQAHHIFAGNPFEDNPNAASQNLTRLSRHMNRRMTGQFPNMNMNMNSNFGPPPRGGMMPPPSGFPTGPMGPMPPSNGPMNPMMGGMRNNLGFPCGACRVDIHDEDAIMCGNSCGLWFHRMCTGLTEVAYTLLTTEYCAEWVCDKCIRAKQVPLMRIKSQPIT